MKFPITNHIPDDISFFIGKKRRFGITSYNFIECLYPELWDSLITSLLEGKKLPESRGAVLSSVSWEGSSLGDSFKKVEEKLLYSRDHVKSSDYKNTLSFNFSKFNESDINNLLSEHNILLFREAFCKGLDELIIYNVREMKKIVTINLALSS